MIKRVMMAGAISIIAVPMLSGAAQAAEPKLEGTFSDWATYSRSEAGDKICYVLATPKKMAPKTVNHGDIYFMVANWKSGKASEQPSLMTGFTMKNTSPPTAIVGSSRSTMFVSQNESLN